LHYLASSIAAGKYISLLVSGVDWNLGRVVADFYNVVGG